MCDANALERHRPTSWSVVMEGVGELYEWPKNWHVREVLEDRTT